jgi:hypothetical protein
MHELSASAAARAVVPDALVSVAVVDQQLGRRLVAEQPGLRFRSASLVKLFIALDALDRRRSAPGLDGRLHTMLSVSDDDIANELWDDDGGPELVTRTVLRLGLPDAQPPVIAGRWGDTMISTADIVATYRYVVDVLPATDRELVVGAMESAPTHGSDGFNQHFGVPKTLPKPWAVKQGWSTTARDRVLHTSGLLGAQWRFAVVVLASFPPDTEWSVAAAAVDAATGSIRPYLSDGEVR